MPDDIDLTTPLGPDDQALMDDLAAAIDETRPVPASWREAGAASFTWRSVDAELAALEYDSLADAGPLVRGAGTNGRTLVFQAPGLRLDCEVDGEDGRFRLIGQVEPPGVTVIEIRHADGVVSVDVDEHGRFRARDLARGPLSLRCAISAEKGSATPRFVETSWLVV